MSAPASKLTVDFWRDKARKLQKDLDDALFRHKYDRDILTATIEEQREKILNLYRQIRDMQDAEEDRRKSTRAAGGPAGY